MAQNFVTVLPNLYMGKYPTIEMREQLVKLGVTHFLDLTEGPEYSLSGATYLNYPIVEEEVPGPGFPDFLQQMVMIMEKGKLYIHCLHGRGRTGLVVVALLMLREKISLVQATALVNQQHRLSYGTSEKWQRKDLPPHKIQKKYLLALERALQEPSVLDKEVIVVSTNKDEN